MFDTPILFLVFNRLNATQQVFNQIKAMQPKYLFISADGPRDNCPGEAQKCNSIKSWLLEEINWDCEVKTLFRDKNLGCGKSVSEAITWFFNHVDEGIILEDDCLPDISFFKYCETLLKKYKNEEKVFMISGDNFRLGKLSIKTSYSFSNYAHVWGWATWKRTWDLYDFKMQLWPTLNPIVFIGEIFKEQEDINYWIEILQQTYEGLIDTWDYQLYFACWYHKALSIEPSVNLVRNIGFGDDATHTFSKPNTLKFGNQKAQSIILNNYPERIEADSEGDKLTFLNRYLKSEIDYAENVAYKKEIKHYLLKAKNIIFSNHSFKVKQRLEKAQIGINQFFWAVKIKVSPPALPVNEFNKKYVHLGCGNINWQNFINVDAMPYKHIHFLSKVNKLPFFRDNSIDLIYVSHCLEHISHVDIPSVLQEWKRVLKPGGKLRISVPDFDLILKIYLDNNKRMESIIQPLMGGQDYEYNFHYSMFNYVFLEQCLRKEMYQNIRRWERGEDEFSNLPDWSGKEIFYNSKSYKISLNIEAYK